jgi:hypothetical protein
MFAKPEWCSRTATLVVRDGRIVKVVRGGTHFVKPASTRHRKNDQAAISNAPLGAHRTTSRSATTSCAPAAGKLIPHACRKRGMTMIINGVAIDDTFAEAFGDEGHPPHHHRAQRNLGACMRRWR